MSEYNGGQVPPPQYQPNYQATPPRKKRTGLKVFAAIVLVCLAGLVGCVAIVGNAVDDSIEDSKGTNQPATPTATAKSTATKPKASAEVKDYEYTDLKVTKDNGPLGSFAGSIVIKNNTDELHDYYVQVTVFKGTQDVGSLMGTIKVKANSSGTLKLRSLDDYAKGATDYQVEITPGL